MDASSPLGAMHRQPLDFGRRDIYRSDPHLSLSPGKPRGALGFGLGDQAFRYPDYFNLKSVNVSSPDGALAADLSQNFRIGEDAR